MAYQPFVLSGTTPAAPGFAVLAEQDNLDLFTELVLDAMVQGATGGTLNLYLQCSNNWRAGLGQTSDGNFTGAPRWYDVAALPQLAAGAAATRYVFSISRGYPATATITVVNPVDNTPVLAANTVLASQLGGAIRLVAVANASTTAGALQTVNCLASQG